MKICHLLWSFTTGGTETMLIDIANEQVKQHDVSIVVVNDKLDLNLCGRIDKHVQFIRINRPCGSRNPWYMIKVNYRILALQPDIVHVHMEGLYKLYKLSIPTVFTAHSNMVKEADLHFYQLTCCISKAVEKTCKRLGANNTCIVYNGIHPELIKGRADIPHRSIKRIVCVGRLTEVKGQHILIEAIHNIVSDNYEMPIELDFIGIGDKEEDLYKMVADYNLSGTINFLGYRDREYIYSHLKDYDLYIMPSINEGFGLTLAEAMTAKIPVLCCDLEGPMEVIDNGRYGLYFKTGDSKSLAAKIKETFSGYTETKLDEARNYVYKNFNVATTAQKYINTYSTVINNKL